MISWNGKVSMEIFKHLSAPFDSSNFYREYIKVQRQKILTLLLWQNPTTITENISGNIWPCFSMKYVCNLLLYNTSSSFKSVSSDSAKHREQDCVSISTIIFTFLLLFLVQFRSWTIAIKKFQRTVDDSLLCHYIHVI